MHTLVFVPGVPFVVKRVLPIVNRGGFKTYVFLVIVLGVPIVVAYWTVASVYVKHKNRKVILPGKDIEEYITIRDDELKSLYPQKGKNSHANLPRRL